MVDLSSEEIPAELKYTEEHMWIEVLEDEVRVGITDFAQEDLGDIEFVDLPIENDDVERGEDLASVESMKAASDLSSPVSGSVSEINEALEDEPGLINVDPYGDGWLCKIKSSSLQEDLGDLLDAESYQEFLKSQ